MIEQRPAFMACKNPGTGWRIDILWADGETEVITQRFCYGARRNQVDFRAFGGVPRKR
ncbi:hypothetical protein AB7M56_001010 [Bradyrhizobium elkanii]